jgi:SAM-dependent methyltransferase
VLELGSGAGFLQEVIPDLITSDISFYSYVQMVMDGQQLPFLNNSLRGIVMSDVLHHIPQPRSFFSESGRCIKTGGVLTMIEPWMTVWSIFVYRFLHHELLYRDAPWNFTSSGPLSGANIALPWIVFKRDRVQFENEFPQWKIESIRLMMPFRYLVSGGVSLKPIMPAWSYLFWRWLESLVNPWMDTWAMFAQITLRRV